MNNQNYTNDKSAVDESWALALLEEAMEGELLKEELAHDTTDPEAVIAVCDHPSSACEYNNEETENRLSAIQLQQKEFEKHKRENLDSEMSIVESGHKWLSRLSALFPKRTS